MSITATELKKNLSYHLSFASEEKIYITQYGKTIAVLTNPIEDKLEDLNNLKGFLGKKSKEEIENAKWQELSEKCGL